MDAPFDLGPIARSLEGFDPLDLAAGIGALQLVPDNASRLLRLEVAAAAVAGLAPVAGRPRMGNQAWYFALNGAPFADPALLVLEDPVTHPFTEALTFHGGSYVVLPGLEEEATFVLRQLAHAVFRQPRPFADASFPAVAFPPVRAVLALSDAVARRAGLRRNAAPTPSPRGTVAVPFPARFSSLKAAVMFTAQDLEGVLAPAGLGSAALAPFVCDQGDPTLAFHPPAGLPMLARPVVRSGDRHVVASPAALLVALRHHLVRLGVEHGVGDELADRYRQAVLSSVSRSAGEFLGCPPVPLRGFDHGALPVDSRFFALDRDKILHAAVVTDRLDGYDPDTPFGEWRAGDVVDQVQRRLPEVEEHVFSVAPPGAVNEVLHVVVVQGVGRFHSYVVAGPQEPVCSFRLALSAADLEVLGLRVGGRPLALWQFAQAAEVARGSATVVSTGLLDEFAFYLSLGDGFFDPDAAKPDLLVVPPGGGGVLHREVLERFDPHAAPAPEGGTLVEVARIDPDVRIPSYTPLPPLAYCVAVLSEALPLRVWTVGPEDLLPDPRYGPRHREFARMLGYWLWQFAPSLAELAEALVSHMEQLVVRFEVVPSEAWFVASEADRLPAVPPVAWEPHGSGLRLSVAATAIPLLQRADNAGEREVLRVLLGALSALAEPAGTTLTEGQIGTMLDLHAPLGPKKMMLLIQAGADRRLDGRDLDPPRTIQGFDERAVLDETGRFLTARRGLPVGPIPDERRTEVLRQVVEHHFVELERLVAALAPGHLLERLVGLNEALIHAQALKRLTVPTRIACFAAEPEIVAELSRELPELSDALVSSRFLIEYVAAQPPRGVRPLGFAVYDRLLATVSEIVDRAFVSDVVHLGLADVTLDVLPSGRLGVERGAYGAAMDRLAGEYAFGEVGRSREGFGRRWTESPDPKLVDDLAAMDDPARAEFGLTFRELLAFLAAATEFGDRLAGPGKAAPLARFVDEVGQGLEWPHQWVWRAVDLFAARPRERFLEPPAPFKRRDVFPWNFARPFSYLRKPLLVRPGSDGRDEVVWGSRNLSMAGMYLWGLCTTGRLDARSGAMKEAMSRLQQAEAEGFNDRVARLYAAIPGAIVRVQVKAIGGRRIERARGEDLGDIDVLVAEPARRRLTAVEVKDFAAARTPWEFAQELRYVFRSADGHRSTVEKHLERTRWLRNHLPDVLAGMGVAPGDGGAWTVEPLLVLDKETPSPDLAASPVPVVAYQRLREQLEPRAG